MSSMNTNDRILGYISHVLLDEEDDFTNNNNTDSSALHATEQSLYDAMNLQHQGSTSSNYDLTHHYSSSELNLFHKEDEPEQLNMHNGVLVFTNKKKKRSPSSKGKEQDEEFIDLKSLLMQCAEAVENYDSEEVNNLMSQITLHSSPHGTAAQRVAHYFVNALRARLAGMGSALLSSVNPKRTSGDEILKGNKMYTNAIPLLTMTNLLANGTIMKRLEKKGATTLHIIDLGILLGFQWLSLILALSELPGGPPMLRITGIDFPQPGIRPDERAMETGARLAEYCERFGVPFEFNAIAQNWDTIGLEDLGLQKGEMVVVNSMFRLQNVMDQADMVSLKVPRDEILNLIRRIDPEMFVHGIVSATYNMPFFVARFREAFYHFLALFDMFEATVPPEEKEDQGARVGFEEHVFGRSVMSVVACEGADREDRPETYKQWQCRTVRAGFRQVSLDKEIVKRVRVMIKEDYHKGFSVAREGRWILLEWKGRVIYGISCWRPSSMNN